MKSFLLASGGAAFLALGVLSAVRPAQAAGLYGAYSYKSGTNTTYNTTRVGIINNSSGTFSELANRDVGFYLTDIAVRNNPTSGGPDLLYGIAGTTANSQNFISIATTGATTTGAGSSLGSITGVNTGEILTGLGFASIGSSTTPTLYAIGGGTGTTTADTGGLYTINTSTGAATLVANVPGLRGSGDIVYDRANDRFFATSLESAIAQGGQSDSNDRVLCFKLGGSEGTTPCAGKNSRVIGSTGLINGTAPSVSSMTGLTIESGNLYGYNGYRSDTGTSSIGRYLIDTDGGAATLRNRPITLNVTAPTGTAGYFSGTANDPSASVPEPLTILGSGLAVGFGALMKVQYSRRRQKT